MLDILARVIEDVPEKAVTFADIRQESCASTEIMVSNGDIQRFGRATKSGAVARALVGECWGMCSSSEPLTFESCRDLLKEAITSARANARFSRKSLDFSGVRPIEQTLSQKCKIDPASVSTEEKLELVMALDKAQKIEDRIINTNSLYKDSKAEFRLVNTAGSRLEWDEIRIFVLVRPIAREGSRMHFDYSAKGGTVGYELAKSINPEEFGADCAKGAIELLGAAKPPSGSMTVIVDGDVSGLIAHEVCGHASEADEVVKKRSFLTDMVGVKVGTDLVTLIDDGTLQGIRGSFPFDSEGTRSSRTAIIEEGIFKRYLHSLETASLMGVAPTGNGRSQDYNRRIFARMTNTFFDSGDWKNDEIISDTKDGLYVLKEHSGMEDVVGGGVQCSVLKGYIIRNGETTQLVRSMTLAGRVLDILKTVDAVGNKLTFSGGGSCGKGEEDFIPVSTGGPIMRAQMVVGGG